MYIYKIVSFTIKVLNIMYNYFKIFSLITTVLTDVTKSFQCKGIFLSDVT